MRKSAIGGYFELELPAQKDLLHPNAVGFQSARAAFLALLLAGKPKRVWIPYYTCRSMLASLNQAGVEPVFYKINGSLHIDQKIDLIDGDWLLYTNYFGICGTYAKSLVSRFDRNSVIIDSSQALFAPPYDCLATVYSPRKFLGVPDGGLLVSSISIHMPQIVDEGSFNRAVPLLKRMAISPEAGYKEHHIAEQTLFDLPPKRMSDMTKRILASVDYDMVRSTRNRNFSYLHKHLGRYNLLQVDMNDINGPLCYPLLSRSAELRQLLIEQRIFVATYWNDVLERVEDTSCEKFLVHGLIPLPCDQRYGEPEMARVVEICGNYLSIIEEEAMTPLRER